MLHKNYHRLGEDFNIFRGLLRKEAENFLIESGINRANIQQQVPEHYRATIAQNANVDEATMRVHDTMYHAYEKMGNIDDQSIWALQDQGAAEINISIISAHMKKELDIIGEVSTRTNDQLQKVAEQVYHIEAAATREGRLPMIEAAMEILGKYRHIAHRLELVNHRRAPSMSCKANKPTRDFEGDGGKLSLDIYIYIYISLSLTFQGSLPYCGPTYGLTDMEAIAARLDRLMDDKVDTTPRQGGLPTKRREPGARG